MAKFIFKMQNILEVKEKLETLEKENSNLKCDAVEGKEDNSKMKNTAWEQEKKITKQKKYKIVDTIDERNASYYALGLALELKEPVAVVCFRNVKKFNNIF